MTTYDEKLRAMRAFGVGEVVERHIPAKRYFELSIDIPIDEAADIAADLARLAIDVDGYFTMQPFSSLNYCRLSIIVSGSIQSSTEADHHGQNTSAAVFGHEVGKAV